MQDEHSVRITVPLIPPSVNHYVKHTRAGWHYVSADAKSWKAAVAFASRGYTVAFPYPSGYVIEATVHLGKGGKGDVDNFAKCILDALKDAGVIHSDSAVTDLTLRKRRDRENPRTEITVTGL